MGGSFDEAGRMITCDGGDVLRELNDAFENPGSARYKYAQSHNNFGAILNAPGNCEDLIKAYDYAGVPVSPAWARYLRLLGKAGSPAQGAQNIYDIAQMRYSGLIEGLAMSTFVHVPKNGGHVHTVRGPKGGISTIDSPCPLPEARP